MHPMCILMSSGIKVHELLMVVRQHTDVAGLLQRHKVLTRVVPSSQDTNVDF